jgi:carboxyl-terminal processing protease
MKSTKGLLLSAIVLFACLFFAFTKNSGHENNYINQKQKLLSIVGNLLEEQHYSPKTINDAFSKQIFKKYLEDLDADKSLFLQSDLNALKKYETTIDDEIHGADIKFAPAVKPIYDKRIVEIMALYKDILSKPFDFTQNESIVLDAEKSNYAANEAEWKERWRKKLKYYTLERYYDLIEQREKNKNDSTVNKPDSSLEKDARLKVLKIFDKTYTRYKVTSTEDELFNKFINTITNYMDPHSDYLPPVEKRAFDEMMSGHFYGIGALLTEAEGQIKIASITPGGAAWKSGAIMANDIILKVAQGSAEPVDVSGYDVTDAVKLIRGNKGTEVKLTVKKQDGTIKIISIIRDEVVLDESFARSAIVKNGNDKIGYIYLPDFYADFEKADGARCSQDVEKEVEKLKAENVKGIVLDLRMNGGGSLYEVVQMVGMFVGKGPVVQVRDRSGKSAVLSDNEHASIYDGPLAVMVNEGSASASEIFAAAIQDYKRGIIIGSTSTYGKGTVQKNVPIGKTLDFFSNRTELGSVKLTFQKFYRINGGSTQLKGITPDVVLPDYYDFMKIREKDNPDALAWDEIAKSTYQTWSHNSTDFDQLIKKENEDINNNLNFKLIKENTQWLAKNMDSPVELNFEKYKQQQKLLRSTTEQINKLSKLPAEMDVEVSILDKNKFYNNPDKNKGERYQRWLKDIKSDMYINQSVKIVSDMIAAPVNTVSK